jgi:hypothetical protein
MGEVATVYPAWFKQQMRRLLGLRFAPATMDTHWEALREMGEPLLAAAIDVGQREWDEFPSPHMLKMAADRVRGRVIPIAEAPDRGVDLAVPVPLGTLSTGRVIRALREWRFYCEDCGDLGWLSVWCGQDDGPKPKPWYGDGPCQRRREHGGHEYVIPCPCASSNPDVQRRREVARQGGRQGSQE